MRACCATSRSATDPAPPHSLPTACRCCPRLLPPCPNARHRLPLQHLTFYLPSPGAPCYLHRHLTPCPLPLPHGLPTCPLPCVLFAAQPPQRSAVGGDHLPAVSLDYRLLDNMVTCSGVALRRRTIPRTCQRNRPPRHPHPRLTLSNRACVLYGLVVGCGRQQHHCYLMPDTLPATFAPPPPALLCCGARMPTALQPLPDACPGRQAPYLARRFYHTLPPPAGLPATPALPSPYHGP